MLEPRLVVTSSVNSRASSYNPALRRNEGVDRLGMIASSLCAVHCAVCALLPAALGALGLGALLGHEAEWVFTLIAIGFAAGALALGWRRHRSLRVAGLLLVGMIGLLASRGIEAGAGHEHGEHHDEHASELVADAHDDSHHHADEASARGIAGVAVGVLGGVLLLTGHLLNLRASRCCDEPGCV